MAEKAMNIYQKMCAATAEISRVAKNLEVGFGKSSYKAVGEADVLAAVKPVEEKYGIYSFPVSRDIIESGVLENVSEYNGQTTTKKQFQMRVSTVYRFVNVDKPEEYLDITTYGDGVDSQDKAPGKAMTYADKYALLKAYKIMTGDDPDQNMSGELKGYSKKSVEKKTLNTEPEIISDKEKEYLKSMCAKAGVNPDDFFHGKLDSFKAKHYTDAVTALQGMIESKK